MSNLILPYVLWFCWVGGWAYTQFRSPMVLTLAWANVLVAQVEGRDPEPDLGRFIRLGLGAIALRVVSWVGGLGLVTLPLLRAL